MAISLNKRRMTKYANDHSTRDLQQTGKATLPDRYLDDPIDVTEFSNPTPTSRAASAIASETRNGGRSTQPSLSNSSIAVAGTGTPSVRVVERPATRTLRPTIAVTTH